MDKKDTEINLSLFLYLSTENFHVDISTQKEALTSEVKDLNSKGRSNEKESLLLYQSQSGSVSHFYFQFLFLFRDISYQKLLCLYLIYVKLI